MLKKQIRDHRLFFFAVMIACGMLLAAPLPLFAETITIDFEDMADGDQITEAYKAQGVVFRCKGPFPEHPLIDDKNTYVWEDDNAISGTKVIGGRFVGDDTMWGHWLGFAAGYGVARFVNVTDYVRLYGVGGPFMVHAYGDSGDLCGTVYSKTLEPLIHPTGKPVHYVEIRVSRGDVATPIKKIEFGCIFPGTEEDLTYFDDFTFNANQYPSAYAGEDATVYEGVTVLLDGTGSTDPDGPEDLSSYTWEQLEGPSVTLSGETIAAPSFVVPPVEGNGVVLSFLLTVKDALGLENSAPVVFDILDNGIDVPHFPSDAFTFTSATLEPLAVKEGEGTKITYLMALDPTLSIETLQNMPDDMRYGTIQFDALVEKPGDVATLQIYFPEPVPKNYTWYKYQRDFGWVDFNRTVISDGAGDGAELSEDRQMITLHVTDNGPFDDNPVEGVVTDPSGLGAEVVVVSGNNTAAVEDDEGCFIGASAGKGFSAIWPF
jgi:hypothetical protein